MASYAEEYVAKIKQGFGVEFWYVYTGPKDKSIDKQITVYNQSRDTLDNRRQCRHYHIGLLETVLDDAAGNIRRLESEQLAIVHGRSFQYDAEFGAALVATVPATELARLYRKYEDKLFERNVRLFLGARKGSINAGIAATLKGTSKANFWAYNNGLTIVCSSFDATKQSVSIENFCIVNGCQSTRSLADNDECLDPSVTVLVRFLAVADDLVDDVIVYNNSQNPIKAWDIASQNKTQRRLKKEFNELAKPYNYITRRGDQPPGNVARYKNGGKPRQIKFTEVAQTLAALVGQPVLAYKEKGLIPQQRHDEIFPPDISVEEVLFAYICGEIVRDVVSKRLENAKENESRILIKGGRLFTLAVMGHIAKLRNGAPYLKSMDEVAVISNNNKDRIKKYAIYAAEAYLNAVKDASENADQELSTLIRNPEFFENKVCDRVEREYRKDKMRGDDWLKAVLPKLGLIQGKNA